jgi:uncharacterized integral membrane protein
VTVTEQPNGATPARHAAEPSIGELVAEASASFSTLIRGEIDLAKLELASSAKRARAGIVCFLAAAVLLVFSLTFGLIALAEGIVAMGIWRWAAYLIVFGLLLVLIGLLAFVGIKQVKKVRAPQQTIATTKDTVAYLKANTKRG